MSTKNQSEDYYSILQCSPGASYQELKHSYQQLIRKYHPDKCGGSQEYFLNIDRAWKTLKDEHLRNQYDNDLQTERDLENILVHSELSKSELTFDDNVKNYPCRCGSNFVIYKEYLDEDECIVECNECSNCIRIK